MRYGLVIGIVLLLLAGCGNPSATDDRPLLVATTGMIGDALQEVAGDSFRVESLMGPGVDPHLYKATQGDLNLLSRADMIFYNGLHLEGKMGEVLENLQRSKPVVAVGEAIPDSLLIRTAAFQGTYDPHIWFDVSLWNQTVAHMQQALSEEFPEFRTSFEDQYQRYARQLDSLHQWVHQKMTAIPRERRVLVTAHDAFGYFGRAYDTEVRGLQGISTQSEFGLRDRSELVNFIVSRGIKAVFIESSVSPRAIEAVVSDVKEKGHDVRVGGELYSDAMGAAGTAEGTYIGMVKANVESITQALK